MQDKISNSLRQDYLAHFLLYKSNPRPIFRRIINNNKNSTANDTSLQNDKR